MRIHLIGDSMMERSFDYGRPRSGWGEPFQNELKKLNISVLNYAKGGASTKTFIVSGRWKFALSGIKKNDPVIIGLCHNDEKRDNPRTFSSSKEFEINLSKIIDDILHVNAVPVLLTPVPLYTFSNETFTDSHQEYIQILKKVSDQKKIRLIDIYGETKKLMTSAGYEKSKLLFNIQPKGLYKNYPNGVADTTHLNINGAKTISQIVFAPLKESGLLKIN
jgi:lysophospholipase L1-like esterase